MSLPQYPNFRPIDITDLTVFDQAFQNHPPVISEFTFTNLYAWREAYKLHVAAFNDFLVLRSETPKRKEFLPLIGSGDIPEAMKRILKDTNAVFIRIPEEIKKYLENDSAFKIEPDRNSADYLYRAKDLVQLAGEKYDGKRNLIRKFKVAASYEYVKLDAANISACLEFEDEWCALKNCDKVKGLSDERRAIREMVKNFSLFRLLAGAIRLQGKICAVALGQRLNLDTLVVHVLKADPNIPGLYQAMNNEFLAREGQGFEYVNMEQDLGVAGLRQSKLSYHPTRMIGKYTVGL